MDRKKLEAALVIEKNDLDNELVNHADMYYEAAKQHVEATGELDALEMEAKELYARTMIKVRDKLNAKEDKVTEAQIKAQVDKHPNWTEHQKKVHEASMKKASAGALMDAFKSRGFVLKSLVELYTANYYHADSVKGKGSDEAKEAALKGKREQAFEAANKGNRPNKKKSKK